MCWRITIESLKKVMGYFCITWTGMKCVLRCHFSQSFVSLVSTKACFFFLRTQNNQNGIVKLKSQRLLMISVHLRWLLFTEKWFQHTNLCQSNNDHADSDKKWPDHHSFIKIFSPFSALKRKKKSRFVPKWFLLVSTNDLSNTWVSLRRWCVW